MRRRATGPPRQPSPRRPSPPPLVEPLQGVQRGQRERSLSLAGINRQEYNRYRTLQRQRVLTDAEYAELRYLRNEIRRTFGFGGPSRPQILP